MLRLAAFSAAATAVAAQSGQWSLTLIDPAKHPMAQCLDGSPGGFYFQPGSGSGAGNWVIHTQGGGWCISDSDCYGRSQSALGSSKPWNATPTDCGATSSSNYPVCTADGGAHGMISSDPTVNPLMYNWNKVFINYCDGGSYAGSVVDPVSVNGNNIYFRGRSILDAIYDNLLGITSTSFGMNTAQNVVVKGCSAGGLAVYLHTDYVAGRINAVNAATRVVASPGAGFFMDLPAFDGTYHYRGNYQWVFAAQNVSGSINSACIADKAPSDQWQCYMAPYTLPYIKTPLFIANSLADAWQGSNIMGLPCTPNCNNNATLQAQVDAYLHNFRLSMISALAPVISSPIHGGFLQSCYQHVVEDIDGSWNGVVINGQTQVQTFTNWFTGNATGRIAVDGDCNVNPTCNKFTGRAKVAPQLQQLKAKATMTLRGTA